MWFFCKRKHLKQPGQRTVTLEEHLVWMREQHELGTIMLSGPSPDLNYGMYLIRSASMGDAIKVADGDPYTKAGDCTYELTQWNIRQIMGVGPFSEDGLGLKGRGL